ncbi:MAG: hypothetical protein ACXQTG_06825 [Methanoculleaceae archaeon]
MDSKDIGALAGAVIIVLLIAIFARPALTGQEVEIWFTPEATPEISPAVQPEQTPLYEETSPQPVTVTPTPYPTWSGTEKALSLVDPAIYHINFTVPDIHLSEPPGSEPPGNITLEPFASISSTGSGTTETFYIPAPYWVIDLSISPYNDIYSAFEIDVIDVADPNREVQNGHIGLYNHDFIRGERYESSHKIFEGYRSYYLVINTRCIRSYTVTIRIPVNEPAGG